MKTESGSDEPKLLPELTSSLARPAVLIGLAAAIFSAGIIFITGIWQPGVIAKETLTTTTGRYSVCLYETHNGIYVSTRENRGWMSVGRSGTSLLASHKKGAGVPIVEQLERQQFEIDVSPDDTCIILRNGEYIWKCEPRYSMSYVSE